MAVRIINADVMDGLRQLPDESVHCVVTSPPYWGLRDYGTAQWDGGDAVCDHIEIVAEAVHKRSTLGANSYRDGLPVDNAAFKGKARQFLSACGKCGAVRIDKQLGLEATPAEFVGKMVAVFAQIRRVLRKDGTCWLNLGDSYAGGGTIGRNDTTPEALARRAAKYGTGTGSGSAVGASGNRLAVGKPKDLIGIPWRVAFALQAAGWYLRQDIIWAKPNPMPESVRDRCTKAHEYIFLLTKSERYFYDADAIAEASVNAWIYDQARRLQRVEAAGGALSGGTGDGISGGDTRNKRSVWEMTTQPFAEAHFATFPPELPEICIKAGCPEGGTVLDPFFGAGTTGLVADRLGRNCIGIELNPEYAALAMRRIRGDCPLFSEVSGEAQEQHPVTRSAS